MKALQILGYILSIGIILNTYGCSSSNPVKEQKTVKKPVTTYIIPKNIGDCKSDDCEKNTIKKKKKRTSKKYESSSVKKESKKGKDIDNNKKISSSITHRSQSLTKESTPKKDLPEKTKDDGLKFDEAMKKIDIINNK